MTELEIEKNIVFLFVRGSTAYGLSNDSSDEDLGGISQPTKNVIYGLDKFEQKDDYVDEYGIKTDKSIYNIIKALDLIVMNNPNMIDYLYAPESCIKIMKPMWEHIVSYRDDFLCKKVKWSYQGYASAQLVRLEKHRYFFLHPMIKPERSHFGLSDISVFPEQQLDIITSIGSEYVNEPDQNKFYDDMALLMDREGALIFKQYISDDCYSKAISDFKRRNDSFLRSIASMSQKFLKEEYQTEAKKELKYIGAMQMWKDYTRWKKTRNPKRKLLEEKCGYDCKQGSHLIRLLKMGHEIISGNGVHVDRTNIDKDELYDIKIGNVSFDDVMQKTKDLNEKINAEYVNNLLLAPEPNIELANKLKYEIYESIMN